MKDTILWLQLKPRCKPDGNYLYSSIKDIEQWIERISRLKISAQEKHYFSLLVEVNSLDLPVNERMVFLELLHQPIMTIIDTLEKKYMGSGLPLAEDKSTSMHKVNSFWSEMAIAYKIIIDDLSESSFLTSFINQKDLSCALYHVLFYLSGQLYSNYILYSACSENVWRDIHQVFRFASKRKLTNKTVNISISQQLTINKLYKKVVLFSLANPYHLTINEMKLVWKYLNIWSEYSDINLNSAKVLKKDYPFGIQPYSDRAPFLNSQNKVAIEDLNLDFSSASSISTWGFETKKLIKQLAKINKYPDISIYLLNRLSRSWAGSTGRMDNRRELIEPVVIALGVSCVSQFLSQIDIKSKILKFDSEETQSLQLTSPFHSLYQAYLIDESKHGFRLKLNHQSDKTILPDIGEVVAVKHVENGVHIGYLRWLRGNSQGEVEFGIEHLSAMAEPVQLTKGSDELSISESDSEKPNVLDSFVFPGSKEHNFKPILFTHTFVEKFYNTRNDTLVLNHKTGSIDIKLVHKVDEVLGYSLYLFEKDSE